MHRRLDTLIYIVSAVFLIGSVSIWWQGVRPARRDGPDLEDRGLIHAQPAGPSTQGGQGDPNQSLPTETSEEPAIVVVHVGGAVKSPGVYRLKEGQRVYEAVMLAEPEEDADLDLLNLASVLRDSQKILVPKKGAPVPPGGWGPGSGSGSGSGSSSGSALDGKTSASAFPLNLNTASASELEALPGIGPVLARAIIDHRDKFGLFQKPEDLTKVSGIGEKTYARISALVVVE